MSSFVASTTTEASAVKLVFSNVYKDFGNSTDWTITVPTDALDQRYRLWRCSVDAVVLSPGRNNGFDSHVMGVFMTGAHRGQSYGGSVVRDETIVATVSKWGLSATNAEYEVTTTCAIMNNVSGQQISVRLRDIANSYAQLTAAQVFTDPIVGENPVTLITSWSPIYHSTIS